MAQSGLGCRCVSSTLCGPGGVTVAEIAESDRSQAHPPGCLLEGACVQAGEEGSGPAMFFAGGFEKFEDTRGEADPSFLPRFCGFLKVEPLVKTLQRGAPRGGGQVVYRQVSTWEVGPRLRTRRTGGRHLYRRWTPVTHCPKGAQGHLEAVAWS